jgi:hypothetical protein
MKNWKPDRENWEKKFYCSVCTGVKPFGALKFLYSVKSETILIKKDLIIRIIVQIEPVI